MVKEIQESLEESPREVGFKVDGRILNELSKQVSSHLFALGELMKNCYDAKATKVNIIFNKKRKLLIIEDNGIGISEEHFRSLLHIAKSGKEYGREFRFLQGEKTITRYTQGSKGLGLFCAFKFGNEVVWDTRHNSKSYKLTVNKTDVINQTDLSQIKIPIEDSDKRTTGTTISISLEVDSEIDYVYSFFLEGKNSKKIVKYFDADDIEISLNLINEKGDSEDGFPKVSMSSDMLNSEYLEKKVLDIDYDSGYTTL